MAKRWIVLFGTVLVGLVLGCGEQPKVIAPEEGEIAAPPTAQEDIFEPEPAGIDMSGGGAPKKEQ